jgi:hypothetical protein
MKLRSLSAMLVIVMVVTLAGASRVEAADNWVGVWSLNLAKSTYSPGPAPKGWTLVFERTADGSIKLTSAGVAGSGQKQSMSFTSKFDGSEVPWTGNPDADACAPMRVSDTVYINIAKKGGKLIQITRIEVSADGKTLTVTQSGTGNNVVVYERRK